ncbi:MAG: phage BR0599 family protein [Rickettsiales bacterium]|nr:phage BR0599 family protein [Rickettsiales bacterium]
MVNAEFIKFLQNGKNITYLIELICENQQLYLTSYDKPIRIDDKVYQSGYVLNSLQLTNIEKTGSIELQIYNNEKDNNFGLEFLSSAKVVIKIAIISCLQQNIIIFNGFVSQINLESNIITITALPNLSKLNSSFCQLYSPLCRECIGSKKCGVDINKYKVDGVITNIIADNCFQGNHQANKSTLIGYYRYGIVKFTSGKLKGISMQIKDEIDGSVYLLQNTKMLSVGDCYEIYAGCDKTLTTCKEKFNNVINFRGEPYINV